MQPLEFLLGHFRGEGRYAMTDYVFQKELLGSFEAGGRFIALRMHATYPLADVQQAIARAEGRGRTGKVLLVGPQ